MKGRPSEMGLAENWAWRRREQYFRRQDKELGWSRLYSGNRDGVSDLIFDESQNLVGDESGGAGHTESTRVVPLSHPNPGDILHGLVL